MITRIVAALLLLTLLIPASVHAQVPGGAGCGAPGTPACSVTLSGGTSAAPYQETYLGKQDLTLTAATAITPTAGATIADLVADPANTVPVFCWADGSTPSASSGIPINAGGSWHIVSASLSSVKCFAASSSTIHIQYGR